MENLGNSEDRNVDPAQIKKEEEIKESQSLKLEESEEDDQEPSVVENGD